MYSEPLSVTELNQTARQLLEEAFPSVWVVGEISNLVRPASGHLYFSLKDATSQIRCAFFRPHSHSIRTDLKNGMQVEIRGKVSVYLDRGDYQLIVERLETTGEGLLRQAYDQLVQKLAALGLFQEKWKKPIPLYPRHIGVITSPTGAAIRDILSVLKRRAPNIPVILYPTLVQGENASSEIVRAIEWANRHAVCDVVILARGGGSLEDLWPFNEEMVAHAIFKSVLPIVSGVGHEIDFTISDLVADKRAPTPSAAAELVSPDQMELLEQFEFLEERLCTEITRILDDYAQKLDWLTRSLRHPGQYIKMQLERLFSLQQQCQAAMSRFIKHQSMQLGSLLRALDALSPLATLSRGYAIVFEADTQSIVHSTSQVEKGDHLNLQLKDGWIECVTEGIKSKSVK